jgi:hypothetical protein
MPITHQIDRKAAFIRTTCSGPVSIREVLDHFRTLGTDPLCPPELDVFLDLREVTSLPTSDQILEVSAAIAGLAPKVRFRACAIITDRDALFGMSRVFSVFADDYFKAIRVFRSADDGKRWLEGQIARPAP